MEATKLLAILLGYAGALYPAYPLVGRASRFIDPSSVVMFIKLLWFWNNINGYQN